MSQDNRGYSMLKFFAPESTHPEDAALMMSNVLSVIRDIFLHQGEEDNDPTICSRSRGGLVFLLTAVGQGIEELSEAVISRKRRKSPREQQPGKESDMDNEELLALRTKLKQGCYYGKDIMSAWIAIDELIDLRDFRDKALAVYPNINLDLESFFKSQAGLAKRNPAN